MLSGDGEREEKFSLKDSGIFSLATGRHCSVELRQQLKSYIWATFFFNQEEKHSLKNT